MFFSYQKNLNDGITITIFDKKQRKYLSRLRYLEVLDDEHLTWK